MAGKTSPSSSHDEEPTQAADSTAATQPGFAHRVWSQKWLLAVLGLTLAIHAGGIIYYRSIPRPVAALPSPEVDLGVFHFEADRPEPGRLAKAEFALHVALSEPMERQGRERLAARKFRVQEDVEELLRKAHSGDFDDPELQGLKRQLQEQINQTLGIRAVAEAIITDLQQHRADRPVAAASAKGGSAPPEDTAATLPDAVRQSPAAGPPTVH
jgi:hypothetical protein